MKTILVVEDVELNRDLLLQLLEDKYQLTFAADGATALERAAATKPDLILMAILGGIALVIVEKRQADGAQEAIRPDAVSRRAEDCLSANALEK